MLFFRRCNLVRDYLLSVFFLTKKWCNLHLKWCIVVWGRTKARWRGKAPLNTEKQEASFIYLFWLFPFINTNQLYSSRWWIRLFFFLFFFFCYLHLKSYVISSDSCNFTSHHRMIFVISWLFHEHQGQTSLSALLSALSRVYWEKTFDAPAFPLPSTLTANM